MITITPILKPVSQIQISPGSLVTIPNVSWAEFESILAELGEKRSARIAYSKCTLEIMVPLPEHERSKLTDRLMCLRYNSHLLDKSLHQCLPF